MRHTATPPNSAETMFQNVEILVTAVHESNGKWLLPQLPQCHLLLTGAVPDKSKIAADDEHIARFHFFEHRILKP